MVHLDIYANYLCEKDPKLDSRALRVLLTTGGPRLKEVFYMEFYGPYLILSSSVINVYTKANVTSASDHFGRIYIGR